MLRTAAVLPAALPPAAAFLLGRRSVRHTLRPRWQVRRCAAEAGEEEDGPFDSPAPAGPAVSVADIPRVLLLTGDAGATQSFSTVTTDPPWLRDKVLREWEEFLWKHTLSRHDDINFWKPLAVAARCMLSQYGLKLLGWSRHPTNTSLMVYTLANDQYSRALPTTAVPFYHIDRLKKLWAGGKEPLYLKDAPGHSPNYRYSERSTLQPAVWPNAEYERFGTEFTPDQPQPAPHLPEVFAIIAGVDSSWSDIRSKPAGVLDKDIREARANHQTQVPDQSSTMCGSSPLVFLLSHLVARYGCRVSKQVVTNNDLTKITYFMQCSRSAVDELPRVPREGRVASHTQPSPRTGRSGRR
eukprot:TRINITY_DN10550_c0_g2_i1.p1 TRINITY_DN10550_c0_g2~~TRINITY_DN10550_c0_g2_i1.p1  ORF type:complete len:354 (+),score=90.81 TRINITY_DN10550_c0_g2_i1:54-1115(+)